MKKCYGHGDLIIRPTKMLWDQLSPEQREQLDRKKIDQKKLDHLILAEGEATGHKHEIVEGDAELIEENGTLYLRVKSKEAKLTHPEHDSIAIPKGTYKVDHQREYAPEESIEKERRVLD